MHLEDFPNLNAMPNCKVSIPPTGPYAAVSMIHMPIVISSFTSLTSTAPCTLTQSPVLKSLPEWK